MQQYDLIALRSFIAVVDSGSFYKAADLLEASTAAVSRRVSGLESALGVRLLNRTTRKIELTQAGLQFYNDIIIIFDSLTEAEERIQQGREVIKGTLRMAAPLSFGIICLSKVLSSFMKRHSELKIQLQLDDRRTDLVAENIDIAIRIGVLKDSTLVATPIAQIPLAFCASPEYLAKYGEPKTPEELNNHNCLHYSLINSNEGWPYTKDGITHNIEVDGTFSANNGDVLTNAAIDGIGIALIPSFIAADGLANGRLITVLSDFAPKPLGLYAIKLSRKYTPTKVKVMIEYLREVFAGLAD